MLLPKKKKGKKGPKAEPAVVLPGSAPKRWPTGVLSSLFEVCEVYFPPKNGLLRAGTIVTITGLKSAAQHNGKRGVVRSFAEDKGRYVVRLEESGEAIRVKPDNALLEEMPTVIRTASNASD